MDLIGLTLKSGRPNARSFTAETDSPAEAPPDRPIFSGQRLGYLLGRRGGTYETPSGLVLRLPCDPVIKGTRGLTTFATQRLARLANRTAVTGSGVAKVSAVSTSA